MTELTNLNALRGANPSTDTLVYVKAHTSDGDKGDGFFEWQTTAPFQSGNGSDYSIDNDGTIIRSNVQSTQGCWIRLYDGDINVNFFGAGGFGNDYTTAIQSAIDFAFLNAGNDSGTSNPLPHMSSSTVYIPSGGYGISTLTLKSGINIIGDSGGKTVLNATNGGTTGQFMFVMDIGPVSFDISNLTLNGNNTLRGGFLLKAQLDSTGTHGGLWNSSFKNLSIIRFQGVGMHFKGGDSSSNFRLPNIHNIIEGVSIGRATDFTQALYLQGQNAQYSFIGCTFNGTVTKDSNDVYTFAKGHNVSIESDLDHTCATIQFLNCSNQNSDYGYYIKNGENILISNNWFENIGVSVTAIPENTDFLRSSKGIVIDDNRFANAAGFGGLNAPNNIKAGQCVSVVDSYVEVSSSFALAGGDFQNANASFLSASNGNAGGIKVRNNTFGGIAPSKTFGIVEVLDWDIQTSILKSFGHDTIFVNYQVPAFPIIKPEIDVIESELGGGENLTIRANGGAVSFSRDGNIFFNTINPNTRLVLQNGETATFIKVDKVLNGYDSFFQLTSVMHAF